MVLPAGFPSLASLDLFASVVELGSLSRAAAAHGMAQPSASERIRNLERQLGLQLLTRSPAGSVPTPAGTLVADWAAAVLVASDQLWLAAGALRAQPAARLVVVASLTVAEHLLPVWLQALYRDRPELAVELQVANSTVVLDRVTQGVADLGFIESPGPVPGLSSRVVATDRLVVVVAPDHPWARRRSPVLAATLSATPLVRREVGSGTRDTLVAALAARGLGEPGAALELGSTSAVGSAAAAGAGPAVLSALAVDDAVSAGRLVVVEVADLDLSRELRAVWRADHPLGRTAQRLLAMASGST